MSCFSKLVDQSAGCRMSLRECFIKALFLVRLHDSGVPKAISLPKASTNVYLLHDQRSWSDGINVWSLEASPTK